MIVYGLVGCLLVYAIYKERQALGCRLIPNGSDCRNDLGKTVIGTKSDLSDSNEELYEKLKNAIYAGDRFVVWRLSVILAFICGLVIWCMCFQRIPTETELLVSLVTISALIYFSFGFYKFHMWDYVHKNAEQTLKYLYGRCSKEQREWGM
jgi:hypothetical protein